MLLTDDMREDTEILAVSVDDREKLQMMVDRISKDDGVLPSYGFLSDPDHGVIDRYGLFNSEDPKGREITHPATFVIDKQGIVRWRFVEVNYKERPTNEDIIAELARLPR